MQGLKLTLAALTMMGLGVATASAAPYYEPEPIPVYPNHPYHSGHYPTADSYYRMPPYAALRPSYYRWRHFMYMDREWNRYRYVPHVFRGYSDDYQE
jgi:hypothetical protein